MGEPQPFGRVRLIEMVVESVRVHMLSSQHVVILKETERDRYLPIWIGPSEANAMWDNMIGRQIRRSTRNLLIWNCILLIGIIVFFALTGRYWYNFLLGPFELDRETLVSLTEAVEGTVEAFARGLRLAKTIGDKHPAYRYEREVEDFFRHSPAVIRRD